MAHLDTAYKLGALKAQVDFEQEINKVAAGAPAPAPRTPGTFPLPNPGEATQAQHATGDAAAAVRPGATAGLAKRTLQQPVVR